MNVGIQVEFRQQQLPPKFHSDRNQFLESQNWVPSLEARDESSASFDYFPKNSGSEPHQEPNNKKEVAYLGLLVHFCKQELEGPLDFVKTSRMSSVERGALVKSESHVGSWENVAGESASHCIVGPSSWMNSK